LKGIHLEESDTKNRIKADRRRAGILALVLSLQALASVFFIADVAQDLRWGGLNLHSGFEAVVAFALIVGTTFGSLQMRQILNRIHQAETAMSVASGGFFDLIELRFAEWGLTPSEAEVALFTLKGLDTADIASARGAAQGTVRAQLAKVYAKAGVSSRGQLTSSFIEDLLMAPNNPAPEAKQNAT
jgi:DNA-binding CsgD family transcriptional regulator